MAKNSWALPNGYDAATRKALRQLFGSLKNAKTHITPEAYEQLRLGNTQAFMGLVDWDSIGGDLSAVQEALKGFASKTGLQLYTDGEIYSDLVFDLVDEKAVIWAKNHTADLVTEITDEMRQQIRDVMAESTQGQLTYSQAARKIRTNLALTTKDSKAVDNYYSKQLDKLTRSGLSIDKATEKASARAERYAAKLLRNRSQAIARTEIANAASEGRKISWETGVADGYIDSASLKEWVAESDACEICGPMDGVTVPYNKNFPSGVMMPPQHPNCRCTAVLLPPEYNDEYWTNYAQGANVGVKVTFTKHLKGEHNQASHGRKGTANLRAASAPKPSFQENPRTIFRGIRLTSGFEGTGDKSLDSLDARIKFDDKKGYGKYWSSSPEVAEQNSTGDHNLNYDWSFTKPSEPVYGAMLEMKLKTDARPVSSEDSVFTFPNEKVMQAPSPVRYGTDVESVTAHYFRRDPDGTRTYVGASELPSNVELDKHLLGGHDQRTHGNRSGGRQSYASSADLFSNQKSIEDAVNSRTNSGTSQFQNGAVATQVLLENQGRGGKPQVFEGDETKTSAEALKEANPDAVLMFRGTDEAYKDSMLNNETDRTGTGVFGEGYYFTNDYNEAQNYASQGLTGRHANPATIVAALSPTAKVKTFKNLDEIVSFGKEAQNEALKNLSFDTADFTLTQFYGMHSTAATTKLILEGFDAMTFQGYNDSQFTVVFDRGALQVAAS